MTEPVVLNADEREFNFDGIVGATHGYGGLSPGNLASERHRGVVGNPKQAALQGLEKMRLVAELGAGQAVLPPQLRPDVEALRRLGFCGSDARVLEQAAKYPELLRSCASASAMWTANAATVAPAADTEDGRMHVTPANLSAMFHRSLEASTTTHILRAIFADTEHFAVHEPLPQMHHFSDEGAANHTRLVTEDGRVHLLAWGRTAGLTTTPSTGQPTRFPARQTLEASQAVARLNRLPEGATLFWQQHPMGIDAGAFHSDVLAVGSGAFLMLHEAAFVDTPSLLEALRERLGSSFGCCLATTAELPLDDAVRAYPFNSQLLALPSGELCLVAPRESEENAASRRYLERIVADDNPVSAVRYVDVNASMNNGGGPACLRLRVTLSQAAQGQVSARVFYDAALHAELTSWIERHYRDRLVWEDLADPRLLDEGRTALDELTRILRLGSVYAFQQAP